VRSSSAIPAARVPKRNTTMIETLLAPLQYDFMVRGFAAAAIVGTVCALLGTYVVLRGMAFFGDALAHAVLPGVALAYLLGGGAQGPLFWGGMLAGVGTALGIGAISRSGQIREDTAIGVIFAGMFALGVALISTAGNFSVDLTHFLFGNVLGVTTGDLTLTAVFAGLVIVLVIAFYKEFLVISFDPVLAAILRLPAQALRYLLLVMIAVTIVVSLQTVGIALMVAMLITPAATASLITRRLPIMMLTGVIIGAFSGIAGLYLSYYTNVASGPAVVLVATALFLLAFLFAPRRGVLWQSSSRLRRAPEASGE
jgi:manganese/iron transport system permease protein